MCSMFKCHFIINKSITSRKFFQTFVFIAFLMLDAYCLILQDCQFNLNLQSLAFVTLDKLHYVDDPFWTDFGLKIKNKTVEVKIVPIFLASLILSNVLYVL